MLHEGRVESLGSAGARAIGFRSYSWILRSRHGDWPGLARPLNRLLLHVRLDVLGSIALAELRTILEADPTVGAEVEKDPWPVGSPRLLADTLREHASAPARVIDPYPTVVEQAQRLGRRAVVAVAAVLVVLVIAFVVAVLVSQPTKETSVFGTAPATALRSASPAIAPTGGTPTVTGSPGAQGPIADVAQPTGPVLVVGWSPRGNAAPKTAGLLANLKSYFATVHGRRDWADAGVVRL